MVTGMNWDISLYPKNVFLYLTQSSVLQFTELKKVLNSWLVSQQPWLNCRLEREFNETLQHRQQPLKPNCLALVLLDLSRHYHARRSWNNKRNNERLKHHVWDWEVSNQHCRKHHERVVQRKKPLLQHVWK